MKIYTKVKKFNSDTYTPVGLYLSLRDHYRKPSLLESNDYNERSNSKSFLGFEPMAEIILKDGVLTFIVDNQIQFENNGSHKELISEIENCLYKLNFQNEHSSNGVFSYTGFEFANYFESKVPAKENTHNLPQLHFILYRYMIVVDHFKDEGEIIENTFDDFTENFDDIFNKLQRKSHPDFPFTTKGEETCATSPDDFLNNIDTGIEHCERGDVFQLVLSRKFKQGFSGEDFAVYRQLRRTNPSPYLFYFDFEDYRLFGSSPEAQIVVKDEIAEIHPIAGTVKKTGNTAEDAKQTEFLIHDEKENAEHIMLVDLARNDLSKHCSDVKVKRLRQIQEFSHVIHLVSKVTGKRKNSTSLQLYADTFPAGTLSGTPKPKALELISKYEKEARGFYGGGIGFIGANGDINMAIIIRSVLSKNNNLYYQAGAGIVLDSLRDSELAEVDNKLRAVRTAIENSKS